MLANLRRGDFSGSSGRVETGEVANGGVGTTGTGRRAGDVGERGVVGLSHGARWRTGLLMKAALRAAGRACSADGELGAFATDSAMDRVGEVGAVDVAVDLAECFECTESSSTSRLTLTTSQPSMDSVVDSDSDEEEERSEKRPDSELVGHVPQHPTRLSLSLLLLLKNNKHLYITMSSPLLSS